MYNKIYSVIKKIIGNRFEIELLGRYLNYIIKIALYCIKIQIILFVNKKCILVVMYCVTTIIIDREQ